MNTTIYQIIRGDEEGRPDRKASYTGKSYSGISYPLRFEVDFEIKLRGFGLFGTTKDSTEDIIYLTINIYSTQNANIKTMILDKSYYEIDLSNHPQNGEIFYLKLKQPLIIPSKTMITVNFQLDPRNAERVLKFFYLPEHYSNYQRKKESKSNVEFIFYSSTQHVHSLFYLKANAVILDSKVLPITSTPLPPIPTNEEQEDNNQHTYCELNKVNFKPENEMDQVNAIGNIKTKRCSLL